MTFTKIRLKWGPGAGDLLTFRFGGINLNDPYLVKSITGLEPPLQPVAISEKAEEGGGYQGRRPDNREIVILMGFQPDYSNNQTVESLRRALYPMLTPKLRYTVNVTLLNDAETETWRTWGYVSKIVPNIFAKDPETQITIECLAPFWVSDQYVYPTPANLSGQTSFTIVNAGDAPSGFEAQFTMTAATTFFRLFTEDEADWIHITYPFQIGDIVYINTTMGSRQVTMTRSGVTTNMLQYFSPNTSWLQLDGGANVFKPNVTTYTCQFWRHTPRYWGI